MGAARRRNEPRFSPIGYLAIPREGKCFNLFTGNLLLLFDHFTICAGSSYHCTVLSGKACEGFEHSSLPSLPSHRQTKKKHQRKIIHLLKGRVLWKQFQGMRYTVPPESTKCTLLSIPGGKRPLPPSVSIVLMPVTFTKALQVSLCVVGRNGENAGDSNTCPRREPAGRFPCLRPIDHSSQMRHQQATPSFT